MQLQSLFGAAVDTATVRTLVTGWLLADNCPLGTDFGKTIESIKPVAEYDGKTLFYVIQFQPAGFVLVSGARDIEPILAFSSGRYNHTSSHDFDEWVRNDVRDRMSLAEENTKSRRPNAIAAAKWDDLLERGAGKTRGTANIDDVRIAPFVVSEWRQNTVNDAACFNYYTPPYNDGDSRNYRCGCSATAWAQVMRYFKYPTTGIGQLQFPCKVDGNPQQLETRGGNGLGGAYDWDSMPLAYDHITTEAQRQAIGALCHDISVVSTSSYTSLGTGGSMRGGKVTNYFHYGNVIRNRGNIEMVALKEKVLNPNLDARLPVLLYLQNPGDHLVVCDGYGYNANTMYHHLNMGWGSFEVDNIWYNLPDVQSSQHDYDRVYSCYFNIYTNGSGEIVSGRALNESGSPLTNVYVRARAGGQADRLTQTGTNGIYAFSRLTSDTTYILTASNAAGLKFPTIEVEVGTSRYSPSRIYSANLWGQDFVGTEKDIPMPPEKLEASTNNSSGILVTWHSVNDADAYRVYRSESIELTGCEPITDWITNRAYTNSELTTLTPGKIFYYRIKTTNTTGESVFSSFAEGMRTSRSGDPPYNITASDGTYTDKVRISFSAVSNATGYLIWRAAEPDAPKKDLLGAATTGSMYDPYYNDTSAKENNVYYYWVKSLTEVKAESTVYTSEYSVAASGWRAAADPTSTPTPSPTPTSTPSPGTIPLFLLLQNE